MERKRYLKIKKYNMILWSFIGTVSFIIIVLTILSMTGVTDPLFDPVIGIVIPLLMVISACSQIRAYFVETMITFRKAEDEEKEAVTDLFSAAKEDMKAQGIDQWDDLYPTGEDVAKDIRNKELCIMLQGSIIVAVYTLNTQQDGAYGFGDFKDTEGNYRVLHRLCVHPKYQHMGMGAKALAHIEEAAAQEGITSIRLDVFTKNPRAVKLYESAGYRYAGDAYYRKGKFCLMEKIL